MVATASKTLKPHPKFQQPMPAEPGFLFFAALFAVHRCDPSQWLLTLRSHLHP